MTVNNLCSGPSCNMCSSGQVCHSNVNDNSVNSFLTAITLIAIICQATGVLCESQSYNFHFASVYLDAIDFVSVRLELHLPFLL